MSTQASTTTVPRLPLTADLPPAIYRHLLNYFNQPSPRQVFQFLHNLPPEFTREVRLRCLQLLQPHTELQLEYFLEPDTQPDDWGVTFPHLFLIDMFDRHAATRVDRASKTTWRQFRKSSIADMFMQHIDTVTFSGGMASPSRFQLSVKFIPNKPPNVYIKYTDFEKVYDRLDFEYIQLEFRKLMIHWKDGWRPDAMSFEVIYIMAARLRKMYQEMVW